jgi:preprotein translocase subunit SecB
MSAMDFPLMLRTVVFVKSHVESLPDHEPTANVTSVAPVNQLNAAKIPDAERLYSLTMHTLVNPMRDPSSPYTVEMECMAVFEADEKMSEEQAMRGVTITGHSVVYGAIRESVAWLTSRQAYGPLMLGLSVLTPMAPAGNQPTQSPAEPTKQG